MSVQAAPAASSSRDYSAYLADNDRYAHIDKVLDRKGPWTDEAFVGGDPVCPLDFIRGQRTDAAASLNSF